MKNLLLQILLITTNDSKKALSAAQGKALNESKIDDAPKDGSPYMRKNGAWSAYTQIEEVYTFEPDLTTEKITQEEYNKLKAAVQAGKVIVLKQQDVPGGYVMSISIFMENTINLLYNAGNSFTLLSITSDLTISVETQYCLLPNNTKEYEVTGDYNPAHKKYVDEAVVANSYKVLPTEILDITQDMASDDIFAKFGGKSAYLDFVKNTPTNSIIRVKGGALCVASMISYTNDNTSTLDIQTLGLNASQYIRVTVSGGTASALTAKYIFVNESDVLKKNNTTAYTPTQHYHPATKAYVDDKVYVVNNSTWEEVLRNNKSINGTDVQALVNKLFGSYSEFLSLLQGVNDNVYIGLKFTDWMYDDIDGYGVGSSYTASNLYAKHNTVEGEFNCNFTYFYKNALKCCIINVNEALNHNYDKLIIQDIVASDNLTTLTKKTAAEYEALGSKDANTVYCVTD